MSRVVGTGLHQQMASPAVYIRRLYFFRAERTDSGACSALVTQLGAKMVVELGLRDCHLTARTLSELDFALVIESVIHQISDLDHLAAVLTAGQHSALFPVVQVQFILVEVV